MTVDKDLKRSSEEKETQLLMGNRAVVQGLLEAKVGLTTAYPGTPSTEIQMLLYRLSQKGQLYFEFSVNEKVAFEIAGAAAMSGVRSAVIMKHVGMNVASDPLMALSYFGVIGGMVVIVVDDPGCLSSQNEQDSRFWGKFAHLPILEPSTSQEVKDTIVKAFELSEKYNMIFFVRMTNYTALNTSEVEKVVIEEKMKRDGHFVKDVKYLIPARYIYHKELHGKLLAIGEDPVFQSFNELKFSDSASDKLVITQGAIYPMVEYARNYVGVDVPILKVSAIHPFSEKQIVSLLKRFKYVYFIEELETYIEDEITSIIGKHNLNIKVFGKNKLGIPQENRLPPDLMLHPFKLIASDPDDEQTWNFKLPESSPYPQVFERDGLLIPRTLPRLCDGCSHRGAFQSIKQAVKADYILPSDIGCYALGQVSPIEIGDFWLCMGASIGTAIGHSLVHKKPVIAIIGDGTFFHAGIPPLIDAVLYDHNITVAILNNRLTAMTGGQPSPSSTVKKAENQNEIDIEQVVRGIGVKWVKSVAAENVQENTKLLKEAIEYEGPAVMIFSGNCVVELLRHNFDLGQAPYVDQEACIYCGICYIDFACPSIVKKDGRIEIREETCTACNICVDVCPHDAIIARKKT